MKGRMGNDKRNRREMKDDERSRHATISPLSSTHIVIYNIQVLEQKGQGKEERDEKKTRKQNGRLQLCVCVFVDRTKTNAKRQCSPLTFHFC